MGTPKGHMISMSTAYGTMVLYSPSPNYLKDYNTNNTQENDGNVLEITKNRQSVEAEYAAKLETHEPIE